MEQPETPRESAPAAPPEAPPPHRPELPDPKGALPIPDHFRLPFHGMVSTPTAVPSATERRYNLSLLQKRRRRRGFLIGLLVGQLLIVAMDLGGAWYFRTHPNVRLQAPVGVASVVFLGMSIGAAVMVVALALIFLALGLRACFRRGGTGLFASMGRGIAGVFRTALALGLSMAVILGTAWFMIPGAEWRPTLDFAKAQGRKALDHSKTSVGSIFKR